MHNKLKYNNENLSLQIPLDLENIPIPVDDDTLVVIIEQFLMLILIIGRWMLPKGDLTRWINATNSVSGRW